MDRAGPGLGETSAEGTIAAQGVPGTVHALFQQRIAGDDALLKLAGLRFAQMGVAAEADHAARCGSLPGRCGAAAARGLARACPARSGPAPGGMRG